MTNGVSPPRLSYKSVPVPHANKNHTVSFAPLTKPNDVYPFRQGQLQVAHARLTGRGVGGDAATSAFAAAISRVVKGGNLDDRALSRLRSSSDAVVVALEEPARGEGRGYSFVACPSHLSVFHASLSRLITAPSPIRDISNIWALTVFFFSMPATIEVELLGNLFFFAD